MQKYRSFVLPIAILLGLLFHKWCALVQGIVPAIIFTILLLNFTATDVKKLRFGWLDFWLITFQIAISLGCYLILTFFHANPIVAEGILAGVLCPVASSVVVISCLLGADRQTVTSYTIWGNLMVAAVAPIIFSFIGTQQGLPFIDSFLLILSKIAPIIAAPFFIALLLQFTLIKVNNFIGRYQSYSFYLWAIALFLSLGNTIDNMFLYGEQHINDFIILGAVSILFCIIQFATGKWLGNKFNDRIAGGQLLGQKNTVMGIWMANTYLNPIAAIFPALYSVWQNLFNSYQLWRKK
ncbi:MAG: transporter [Bacteroidales bacterium]|nr:transporter [Bacteroidales bacterium]